MHRIAIVAFPGCQPLDVVGPFDVFAAAAAIARVQPASRGTRGYQIQIVAPQAGPLRSEGGLQLVADTTLAHLARARTPAPHTLIIAGGAGARRAADDARVVRAVERLARRAQRVASVCTGAFVLAAAGLLDGKPATTHWAHCDQLARRWPTVKIERDPIFVRADRKTWTSAGVTAGIDLCLALVEEDLGRELASVVARELVVFVRRAGGQSQFSAQLAVQAAERAPIRELQAWIVDHPDAALGVPNLARKVAMSVRNFSRVFHAEVGVGPAAYVENVRVETARRLLETTAMSIEQVAQGAGFGTPEAFRRAIHRRLGLAPREYRARFGDGSKVKQTITKTKGERDGARNARTV
jgi:transcriptional regulator GlxA family with amidase domain